MQTREEPRIEERVSVFSRVLVGIDDSPESLDAARQGAKLAEGPVTLLSAYDLAAGLVGGVGPAVPAYLDEAPFREDAERSLEGALSEIGETPATVKTGRGRAWDVLLREIERRADTLVAVGSHGRGRALGIVLGSTATELIHKAPCSVLVARPAMGEFPRRIVVGLDGSDQSIAAFEAAKELAERFDAELVPLLAYVDADVDVDAARAVVEDHLRTVSDLPVEALISASADADLVVVGSRGLRGLKALGSVSERVAHQAASSVLVVRTPS